MGQVYRARDTKLNRDVALKVLPDSFANDPDRLARFQREAQVLASLNHPNIAHIHGLEDNGGVRALVMELVEGEDLAQRLARGAIPIEEALPIAKQIAEALEAAHEQGIIHRDLKPANIKVRPDGTVKVLDFGLAKAVEAAGAPSASVSMSPTITSPAMTQAGMILGTAAYMSPEQARGKPTDRRADIWAFGCVVFEMLTGRPAFDPGETVSDAIVAILSRDPAWSALPPDTPPHVLRLLRRCLQKDPQKRLPHIGVARLEIDEGPSEASVSPASASAGDTRPEKRTRRYGSMASLIAVTAIVFAAISGAAAWRFKLAPPPAPVARFSFLLSEGQNFTNTGRQLIAISPDGSQMVYVANNQLYLRSMSELEARPIPGTQVEQGVLNPVFSPDSQSIAFFSGADQTLKRVAVSGGAPVTICPASAPFGVSWGTDGILYGQGRGGILRTSANGGTPEQIVAVKADEVAHGPQMLPGGETVLFTLATGTSDDRWDKASIVAQSLKSGERTTLVTGGSDGRYLPTGHLVYALSGALFAVPFDVIRLATTGGPVSSVEGVRRAGNNTATAQFSVSSGGSLIYVPGPASTTFAHLDLALIDRTGAVQRLKLSPTTYLYPRISPDGGRVAVQTDDGKESSIAIYDLSGVSPIRRLTFGGNNRFPMWSPDGQRVVFQSDREGDNGIFWQRADGSGPAERITKADEGTSHIPESWPKGDRFSFSVVKAAQVSLWTYSMRDKKAAPFDAVRSLVLPNSAFSPDGRWLAYNIGEGPGNAGDVFVQPFPPDGSKYEITRAGINPLWSPDGKELLYSGGSGAPFFAVDVTTAPSFTFSKPVAVPRAGLVGANPIASPRYVDIAADGKHLIGVIDSTTTQPGAAASRTIEVVLNWTEELKQRVPTR
jgi:Tol biopolymer transport system component